MHKDDTPGSGGWIEVEEKGALPTLNAKNGWREVEIGRGSSDQSCPIQALEQWLHFSNITGQMRGAFYLSYDAKYVSPIYVFGFAAVAGTFGLLFLWRYHRDIMEL